ncbi:dolichyl pyrophosphate Man9GlcNAc2 alpha-1,3-glucosyltransferase-like isoform X1 [Coccinella septempunctata]|uniref:dolichyl pyrophosphate Man9GlcNAc2 alpha-1,3-glucosyltransferase-like isoform X1 n=1 Tax=Coccinella septempunctata TaxID=41139 RepID=UPI001D08E638|nr:dolichyl pyrophosphate Man9GlcNAc2 alpha-1,3-glucosyltransferase-like isoform X1 [Coccinella septempunctata]XP_044762889.1 dolichyl pyrophosphate Man9GlcNAc2 alpha-1,3-glucosyltransferase-like isoform X1 [Coccinella septempunctata]
MVVEKKFSLRMSFENWLLLFGILLAILLRNITMLHPYSGQGNPPMYGDFEAQRHWMEITTNLPVKDWYRNTSDNNLQYWGLDYPPLTAYHMYFCGLIASYLNPNYTSLHNSRGFESDGLKNFMRMSVLIIDLLLYMPTVMIFYYTSVEFYQSIQVSRVESKKKPPLLHPFLSTILAFYYPGNVLIDHGHFQYNCASLGFTTLSVIFLIRGKNIFASVFFCFALNYKQMELYHSLPFFFYLLSTCIPRPGQKAISGLLSLFKIGLAVILTFYIIWYPFVSDFKSILQVLERLFPFNRGIFEDKVANFWCIVNVFYKLKTCDHSKLMRLCLFTTLSAVFPSSIDLFSRPNLRKFILALINSSLAFFLFSYQVHEKTILVAALPVVLYTPEDPFVCFWFLFVSVFSMLHLFVKDDLLDSVPTLLICYSTIFCLCMMYAYWRTKNSKNRPSIFQFIQYILEEEGCKTENDSNWKLLRYFARMKKDYSFLRNFLFTFTMAMSFVGCILILILYSVVTPPARYPDLFPLITSAYCCVHFLGFFLYFNIKQLQIPQDFGDIGDVKLK